MDKNWIIGLIVLFLVVVGGGLVYSMNRSAPVAQNATSTPQIIQNDNVANVNILPQATSPIAVTSSTVSPSATTVIVSGSVSPRGAFTNYWYEYGKTSDLGIKTANQTMGSGFVSIQAPAYITELSKNTTYYFKLVAENQYGKVAGNQYTFRTTESTPPPVGSAPSVKTVTANGISKTTANINGEITVNKSETQYWFEYGKTAQLGNTSAFFSAANTGDKSLVSISLSNLDPSTGYYFRINAQNRFGTINGSILNFKTLGPKIEKTN